MRARSSAISPCGAGIAERIDMRGEGGVDLRPILRRQRASRQRESDLLFDAHVLVKARAKTRDLADQIRDPRPVRRPASSRRGRECASPGPDSTSCSRSSRSRTSPQFVGALANLREQEFAFLGVMEALGEGVEIVGDQGDGVQVLVRRRAPAGSRPRTPSALATRSMLRCSASMTASARMRVTPPAISAPR